MKSTNNFNPGKAGAATNPINPRLMSLRAKHPVHAGRWVSRNQTH